MVTLSDVTQKTKLLIKWSAIILGGLIALIFFFKIGAAVKEMFFPTPLPKPTVGFGKLPAIEFPDSFTSKSLSYSINTVSGALPEIADRISIYKIVPPSADLLAKQNAQTAAANTGFNQAGIRVSESIYQWTDQKEYTKRLLYNIFSHNFTLSSDYLTNPSALLAQNLPAPQQAVSLVQSFLNHLNTLPTDLDSTKTKQSQFAIANGALVPTSLASANIIRLDFFQKDIDQKDEVAKKQLKSVSLSYPHPPYSPMTFYISSSINLAGEIVFASYFHQNISGEYETYPIKKVSQAFAQLQDGQAYIASYFGAGGTVPINEVKLGYFMNDKAQNYLMPIYIFSGEDGFIGYISAVKDEWLGQ